jgi:hypothetical protein
VDNRGNSQGLIPRSPIHETSLAEGAIAKKAKAGPRERPRQVQLQLTIPEVAPPGIREIFSPRKELGSTGLRVTGFVPEADS